MPKQHLGNEVYATFDGHKLWLTQEKGQRVLDMIEMDRATASALFKFLMSVPPAKYIVSAPSS